MKTLKLRKGRDSSLLRNHPWVFSGAVAELSAEPEAGETIMLLSHAGESLALAAWSPKSQIRARVWSFDIAEVIDRRFFQNRLKAAMLRRGLEPGVAPERACRLVYGESDRLPGLVVDCYPPYLVCQFLTVGSERWKSDIVSLLTELTACEGIYERSDVAVRSHEGLPKATGVLWGEAPPDALELLDQRPGQAEMRFLIDIPGGHKTGFYLDQTRNRRIVSEYAADRKVLNCFSYSGAFGVACLAGGAAHVTNVDSSGAALALCDRNMALNGFEAGRYGNVEANVFELLRDYRKQNKRYDMVILDPPKFADTKTHLKKAARAYKDIALQAAHLLNPGGVLVSFSCSGAIDMSLFQKIVADGLLDAGRSGQVVRYLHQYDDHPVGLPFPESQYLKGLVCRVE